MIATEIFQSWIEVLDEAFIPLHGDCQMSTDGGLGGGGFFGAGPGGMGPGGHYGCWPGCGCSSIFIILAGILLVFGGCLRMLGQ